jgi:signal transduction histidine kinase
MQEQLNLINRISDELNKDLDPDKMLRRVLNLTVSHLNASTGSIMLFDQENRVSAFILQQEDLSAERAKRIVGKVLTEGFAGWMLKNGEGGIIYDTHQDNRWVVYDNQPYDVRSVVGSPLLRRQRVLGVLTVVRNEPNYFTEVDLSLITAIAGQAAIALENAHLFKETEQERHKLSAIINSTQDAVLVTTAENKTLLLNPAAQEVLGINNRPWQDKPLAKLTHNQALLKLFGPDSPTTGEVPLPDGRTMWASITEIAELGRVIVLRDISAFKALDKMKRDFVTAFTHDLRTPLATVKGYVELVRMDGPVTDRQEEDLVGITRAANLMKSQIEDLIQLSRLERLEQLTLEKLHLEETVESAINVIRPLAKTKGIDFAWDEWQNNLIVEGNPVLLSRAVGNLLDNAIKYTPQGGQVRINLTQANHQALISVIDNGPGIFAKDLPRVFEKFFRARPELDDVPGTGLGLAIVKTIVEQHGGQVRVESEPNVGSTFTITLPLVQNGG